MKSGGNQYAKSITANITYMKIIHLVVIVLVQTIVLQLKNTRQKVRIKNEKMQYMWQKI